MNIPTLKDVTQHKKILTVPEIRVWCHPHLINKSGDDYYNIFPTFEDALKFIETHKEAEATPLIAFGGYEIDIFKIKKVKITL